MTANPTNTAAHALQVRALGYVDYTEVWQRMRAFTETRTRSTPDELWSVEHPPTYTMGLKGRNGKLNEIHGIPLVYSDRGGDMTYHGPGQVVLYALLDLARLHLGIKTLVHTLEQAMLDYLRQHRIDAHRRPGAPGVYVENRKIAALGLRVRGSYSYHGLAFNVDMDLTPFRRIDPCGCRGLEVTQLTDFDVRLPLASVSAALAGRLGVLLGYNAQVNSSAVNIGMSSTAP